MERNLILAGVGGQGILTIARAISIAATHRGWHIKQSEVHGMAQRGGAVHAHLRIADHEIFSDLIPLGAADAIIAVEPLEALRYLQYLKPEGAVISSTNAFTNIPNYPPVEQVLDRVSRLPNHVLLDASHLAGLSGSARATNTVLLGAASVLLDLPADEMDRAVRELFSPKGEDVAAVNCRALRLGTAAAHAYTEGLRRGGGSAAVRRWIDGISAETLLSGRADFDQLATLADEHALTAAESHAVRRLLEHVQAEGRTQLYEHEVYVLIELTGAISPPRYQFVPRGQRYAPESTGAMTGSKVVLKIVSADVVHKSDVGGIAVVPNDPEAINRGLVQLIGRHEKKADVAGVLVVEFVEHLHHGFGSELFVGIRASREFGPVIAAGLGGVDTEYLASRMLPGVAVAKAVVSGTTPEKFLELFKKTAAYEVLAGKVRGHERVVSDAELMRCFRAFMSIARKFCVARDDAGPTLEELEVNPFAFRQQHLVPLDGRARLGKVAAGKPARPRDKMQCLTDPRTIAVLGVSANEKSFGRVILNNIRRCGFPADRLHVIKPGVADVDGVPCVPDIAALPEPVDLLIVAAGAKQLPDIVSAAIDGGKTRACIMIPGGVGETEGSDALESRVRDLIFASRKRPDGGPIFVGPNCLGIQSRTGRYDTFFIPPDRLDTQWDAPARPAAIISQSGAFIITRLSNLECLNPVLTISIGNQIDATHSDMLRAVAARSDIHAIGVYVEGFDDLDGLEFLDAVSAAAAAEKTVIFYKAGRTDTGRTAAAGHTASVAGDYDVCQSAVAQAGAIVVDTFKEFEQLLELSTALHEKTVAGRRVGVVTNAGFEAVGMADAIQGPRYRVEIPPLRPQTVSQLGRLLEQHQLNGLVNPRNPLDLTPMATEAAYEDSIRLMQQSDEIDAIVVSLVPLAPQLFVTDEQITRAESLARRVPALFRESRKPLIFVVDAGPLYDPLVRAVRFAGVPVFRTCDQALRSLGRYLCFRAPGPAPADPREDNVAASPSATRKSHRRRDVAAAPA